MVVILPPGRGVRVRAVTIAFPQVTLLNESLVLALTGYRRGLGCTHGAPSTADLESDRNIWSGHRVRSEYLLSGPQGVATLAEQ
jgi:hypothetical protein